MRSVAVEASRYGHSSDAFPYLFLRARLERKANSEKKQEKGKSYEGGQPVADLSMGLPRYTSGKLIGGVATIPEKRVDLEKRGPEFFLGLSQVNLPHTPYGHCS